jgi:hypothetical protein
MQEVSFSSRTIVTRSSSLLEADVNGEVVALHIDKGACYGLNKVGSRVWHLIATPTAIGDLCATLVSEFKVDQATCERDVLDLLAELHAEGLVEVRR